MKITKVQITIEELFKGYKDNNDDGVVGYGGKLDIRPPYQREFVYKEAQRNAVIDSVINGFPLSIMYWNTKADGNFEVLDGQQRTISICEYVNNDFSFENKMFSRQPADIREKIMDYELDIYQCRGTESERIKWFKVINVAGETLTEQEIRNAVYAGPWTAAAKIKFSKKGCPAYQVAEKFMAKGKSPIRQDYLEAAIKWLSKDKIEEYMDKHAKETDCNELWLYWGGVFAWVNATFIGDKDDYREKEMKNVQWGELYNQFKDTKLDAKAIQNRVSKLMQDEDVTKLSGIYPYVLDGKEKHLSIRLFKNSDKRNAFEQQDGVCPKCKKKFDITEMEGDHITPWNQGGKTIMDNCQMLCLECNRQKGKK